MDRDFLQRSRRQNWARFWPESSDNRWDIDANRHWATFKLQIPKPYSTREHMIFQQDLVSDHLLIDFHEHNGISLPRKRPRMPDLPSHRISRPAKSLQTFQSAGQNRNLLSLPSQRQRAHHYVQWPMDQGEGALEAPRNRELFFSGLGNATVSNQERGTAAAGVMESIPRHSHLQSPTGDTRHGALNSIPGEDVVQGSATILGRTDGMPPQQNSVALGHRNCSAAGERQVRGRQHGRQRREEQETEREQDAEEQERGQARQTRQQQPEQRPCVQRRASSLGDLLAIRAFHSRSLRQHSLGTALGLRIRNGELTNQPAILVFVSRKVHDQWLLPTQRLPKKLHGPDGCLWCDVDVVEFSHLSGNTGQPVPSAAPAGGDPLVEGLRGADATIGPGSQLASDEIYGTLCALVRSRSPPNHLGVLTNQHVAVDFDLPRQHVYHPFPPHLGPGTLVGSVERASSFTSDFAWYGTFAGRNPETFVRADGCFIPFHSAFDRRCLSPLIKGLGEFGQPKNIRLTDPPSSIVGVPVLKLGCGSSLTSGHILAYSVEYNDDKGNTFLTDFLILGDNGRPFDTQGDSGSLVVTCPRGIHITDPKYDLKLKAGEEEPMSLLQVPDRLPAPTLGSNPTVTSQGQDAPSTAPAHEERTPQAEGHQRSALERELQTCALPQPIGIIWGGTANRGRLKLRGRNIAENWTSAIDIGRLLELLDLELVTRTREIEQGNGPAATGNAQAHPPAPGNPPDATGFGSENPSSGASAPSNQEDAAQVGSLGGSLPHSSVDNSSSFPGRGNEAEVNVRVDVTPGKDQELLRTARQPGDESRMEEDKREGLAALGKRARP